MMREFQVAYQASPESSPVQTVNLIAESENKVQCKMVEAGFRVISVTQIRAVVDWDKPVWDLDEFAAAMGIKGSYLSAKKGDGTIPWSSKVNGVPSRLAMKWIEGTLNEAGKKLVDR
jgi:hypothetical protein